MIFMNKKFNHNSGFTLIELMVATSIFMMVILSALGALMITSNAAKESKALRYAMDNVNFAMDTMTRNIRLGSDFHCTDPLPGILVPVNTPLDCPLGKSRIIFTKPDSPMGSFDVSYQIAFGPKGGHVVEKCDSKAGCAPITAPEVDITDLKFVVRGSDPVDYIQPSVEILLQGNVTISGKVTTFSLQSLASQRTFE